MEDSEKMQKLLIALRMNADQLGGKGPRVQIPASRPSNK